MYYSQQFNRLRFLIGWTLNGSQYLQDLLQELDKYTFEESKADGATLEIYYEERMPELFVEGADTIDQIFERVFADLDTDTKNKIKKQYVTKGKIAEAPARVRKICFDLVDHYTKRIQPDGYKAMLVASSREAAVTYKRELDKLNAPISKIIMTSHLGEKGKDGSSWDEFYLTPEQREKESEWFKDPNIPTQILIVVDMLLVGYDVPIVQVMYLDNGLREHNLLQAIARVNRPYDERKDRGLIVDYCGITKELQKALAIFEEEDIKGALEPAEKELEELRLRHLDVMSFFKDIPNREDDDTIIEKFEPVNVRDEFEYAFKMFSKSLEAILPQKEADPYIDDYKYAGKKRFLIRNNYGGVGQNLREYGKKVQQLIDDHIRSLNISPLLDERNITYENFLGYVSTKFKSDRARTALIKNKARQIIREFAPNNPAYYEKLRERLEKIIKEEEERRKGEADYFNNYKEIYEEALSEDKKRKDLGFSTKFEFAVYSEIQPIVNNDKESKNKTKLIFEKIKNETEIVGWKTKTSSKKNMSIIIYDILTENKFPDDKVDEITSKIIHLAERNL